MNDRRQLSKQEQMLTVFNLPTLKNSSFLVRGDEQMQLFHITETQKQHEYAIGIENIKSNEEQYVQKNNYQTKYNNLKSQLRNSISQINLYQTKDQQNFNQQQQQIQNQSLSEIFQKQGQLNQNANDTVTIIILIAFVVIFSTLFYILYKRSKENQQEDFLKAQKHLGFEYSTQSKLLNKDIENNSKNYLDVPLNKVKQTLLKSNFNNHNQSERPIKLKKKLKTSKKIYLDSNIKINGLKTNKQVNDDYTTNN